MEPTLDLGNDLLAARSIPDEALELAIRRAEQGDRITTAVAKRIVGGVRKRGKPPAVGQPVGGWRGRVGRLPQPVGVSHGGGAGCKRLLSRALRGQDCPT